MLVHRDGSQYKYGETQMARNCAHRLKTRHRSEIDDTASEHTRSNHTLRLRERERVALALRVRDLLRDRVRLRLPVALPLRDCGGGA